MNTPAHILVVEDDPSLSQWICDYLIQQNFTVSLASQGDTALELIESDNPDLVLLDIMLPVVNGFDICKTVRSTFTNPILMMTACSEETDEVLGLELGADDYLTKPIRPRVLLARIKSLLRRSESEVQDSNTKSFGSLLIDADNKTVQYQNEMVNLTVNEFEVLWYLAENAGKVVSRDDLLSHFRGFEYDGFDRSIDIRISRLRKKLQDNVAENPKIKTVRGKGYLFTPSAW
ncbi:response regulator transcription factor [Catenovulum sp. SM1970]|uniref:response regulator transcription factor n=1 Tax=Marinifaba aquimaris TaxID=2741323 RepID=UPI0015717744|nr:response regulator transcription factor [Marinifaba aquimaris]NTS76075.1 response regulator transcription factor [Marinifaba aquimaris]